jgi:hypothetical protein
MGSSLQLADETARLTRRYGDVENLTGKRKESKTGSEVEKVEAGMGGTSGQPRRGVIIGETPAQLPNSEVVVGLFVSVRDTHTLTHTHTHTHTETNTHTHTHTEREREREGERERERGKEIQLFHPPRAD